MVLVVDTSNGINEGLIEDTTVGYPTNDIKHKGIKMHLLSLKMEDKR